MEKYDASSMLDEFESEARTHIDRIESAFLDPELLISTPGAVDEIFRAAHSLKGTAGFFSLDKVVNIAHALESVFAGIRDDGIKPDNNMADAVLRCADCLRILIDNINDTDSIKIDPLIQQLNTYSNPTRRRSLCSGSRISC